MKDLYSLFTAHPSISTDSRKIKAGDLFFALRGDRFDGNDYAEKAIESGAACAVVDHAGLFEASPYGRRAGRRAQLLQVPNVLEALQQLARRHRREGNVPVMALTGTNGKTTSKELIAAVLAARFNVCATQGNLNNHIGVPLTLLRMNLQTEVAVVEMGANHPGEIAELAAMARPDYGLITNVGRAHLEGFGSLEGVMQTKGDLYEAAETLFVNADDPVLCSMAAQRAARKEKHFYGLRYQEATILAADAQHPFLRLNVPGYGMVETQLAGAYNADNVLAALAVGARFGVDAALAVSAVRNYRPSNHRSQWKQTAKNRLIIDAYNANPASMAAAMDHFEQLPEACKAVILGDMLELGADSEQEHRTLVQRLVRQCEAAGIRQAFLVGPRLGAAAQGTSCACFADAGVLRDYLSAYPLTGATVLVKGSRGMRLEQVLDLL